MTKNAHFPSFEFLSCQTLTEIDTIISRRNRTKMAVFIEIGRKKLFYAETSQFFESKTEIDLKLIRLKSKTVIFSQFDYFYQIFAFPNFFSRFLIEN